MEKKLKIHFIEQVRDFSSDVLMGTHISRRFFF